MGGKTHGHNRRGLRSPTYQTWVAMLTRCTNPRSARYVDYGARGVTVCARWRSFEAFLADMGPRPDRMTIERIDNSRGYEPGNCRWATAAQQGLNQRSNVLVTYNGLTLPIAEWARRLGMRFPTLYSRIKQYGWPVERALTEGVRR